MRLAELPAPEVARRIADGHAVLLPLGSTETHGPALPMGDHLLAEAIALRVAEAHGRALVAPPIPFGGEDFFRGVPGGVALSHGTLSALLTEILTALRDGGARRLLIVNGHGGNIPAIEEAQRRLRHASGLVAPALHLWRSAGAWQAELGGDAAALGHGGDPVASVALHLRPELCHPERLAPRAAPAPFLGLPVTGFGSVRAGGVEFGVPIELPEIAPGGTQAADPRGASAAHGARITERLVAAGAAMLAALETT
ncbi:MAG: creatininase family protein [Acetobacteraceae bacterium]|nr:creatininase family protein [Acetobacteraceae bacterium]